MKLRNGILLCSGLILASQIMIGSDNQSSNPDSSLPSRKRKRIETPPIAPERARARSLSDSALEGIIARTLLPQVVGTTSPAFSNSPQTFNSETASCFKVSPYYPPTATSAAAAPKTPRSRRSAT